MNRQNNPDTISFREAKEGSKLRVYASDGLDESRFTRHKKGVYTVGGQKIRNVIDNNRAALLQLGLTDSAINVMIAVSENEGNLDAVNTWDNSFLSFGMFQWTLGAGNNAGELAALLAKIKKADPAVFEKYYGQYGVDIKLTTNFHGFFILDGMKLIIPSDKKKMRTNEWAFRFWKSGQDPFVQLIQVEHALSRLKSFYRSDAYIVNGFYISELITSEYSVGLILDNHVNRPGYLRSCLELAMKEIGLFDPSDWGTNEETRLIEAYLKIRISYGRYPMTHADKRADVTRKYLDNGTISAERGSFQYPF